MNKEYVALSELTKEIYYEKLSKTQPMDDSFRKSISIKFNYLMNSVVMRSKFDWRYKQKNMIPSKDKSIVKSLLIKSYYPLNNNDEDQIFVDWFNDRIDEDDYDKIIELGNCVESFIRAEVSYEDWELDDVTIDEWIAAIHSSINFTRALSIKKFAYEMKNLYDNSNVLNHDMPFGDMIKENEYGKRSYIWKGLHPNIDTSLPLNEVLTGCFSQEDYANLVLQLMLVIMQDCQNKTVDFIKAYAEIKKMSGCACADELLGTDSLASEYVKFFQNIYDYLYDRPKLTREIEIEIGTDNLLSFFKMKDRNAKNPKKTKKK